MAEIDFTLIDRKLDRILGELAAVREEIHDMRAEAAVDRGRVAGTDNALVAVQRRLLRTDERPEQIERRLDAIADG